MENKRVLITDTILRDAHQSHAATRMKFEEMEPVLALLDEVGYYSLEAWGGATFDSCLRFLNEDPWDRLKFKKIFKKDAYSDAFARTEFARLSSLCRRCG